MDCELEIMWDWKIAIVVSHKIFMILLFLDRSRRWISTNCECKLAPRMARKNKFDKRENARFPARIFIVTFAFCHTKPQVLFSSEIHGALNFYSPFLRFSEASTARKDWREEGERGIGKWKFSRSHQTVAGSEGGENVWMVVGGCHGAISSPGGEVQKHFHHYP